MMRSILAWSMIAVAGCGSGASRTGASARGGESPSALQVDNTTTLRLDISRDEYSASGAISALPTSTSADTCADSYERADEVTSCIEAVLADNLVGSPASSFRLYFRSGASSLGGMGTIGSPRGK